MKKLLLSFLAIAAMASCVKEQTVNAPVQQQISFGEFIQNRAAIDPSFNNDTNKVEAFDVWAFMTSNTGVVFNKERVTRSGDTWTYRNLAYWAPERTYKFAALSPVDNSDIELTLAVDNKYMSNEGALGTVNFTNQDGTVDLLYAVDEVITPDVIPANPEKVEFTFQHLLSKVKFTFTNGLVNPNTTMAISDVKMIVPAKGSIDLAVAPYTWTITDNSTTTLSFGNVIDEADANNTKLAVAGKGEVANERLTIPVASTQALVSSYEVSFVVTIYNGTELANTIEKTATISGTTLLPGKCYNFTAILNAENLDLKPIEFTALVEDWVHGADYGFLN